MTRDEVTEIVHSMPRGMDADDYLVELVSRAILREREACAKVCDEILEHTKKLGNNDAMLTAISCAVAILARGEK